MEADATWVLPYNFHQASYYSMEPGDDFQLAQWTMQEQPAVWAHGLPVESVRCLQTSSAPITISSSTEMQLVEYAVAAAQKDDDDDDDDDDAIETTEKVAAQEFEIDLHNMVLQIHTNPIHVFEKVAREFKVDVDMMRMKMHRYPASIRSISGEVIYTIPTTVAIGPYHHGRDHLKPAEKVKHVAAYHCIRESGLSVQEMYDAVVSVAGDARALYDGGAVAGVGDDDFLPMMFFDACFLVQYMATCTGAGAQMDPALRSFFDANDNDIFRDITQLENQLPWRVVEAVMRFRRVSLTEIVKSLRGCLQDRKDFDEKQPLVMDESYEPPHLLALLRFYIIGRSDRKLPTLKETEAISFSVSTIELAEIGIELTPNKTTELIDMGVKDKGRLFAELYMAPLSLDDTRASLLINMAALELCTTPSFHDADDEESAVCSYLLLLGMIVDREEDVHELRARRLLQGGGGLSNRDALNFLTSLHGLRLGSRYVRTMEEIEDYKMKRNTRTKVHAFVYRNMKTIVAIISGITAMIGIIGTLKSLKVVN